MRSSILKSKGSKKNIKSYFCRAVISFLYVPVSVSETQNGLKAYQHIPELAFSSSSPESRLGLQSSTHSPVLLYDPRKTY